VTRAAAEGRIVEVTGDEGWREAFPKASNIPAIAGVRAITALPMQAGGELHGVLVVGWRTAEDRTAVDRGLLSTAADQAAQALERARLHAQDADARRLQEAFIGVVSHELRTPITTILAGSRILRRRLDGDAASADLSDDIAAEADRLSRIVEDLLVLSRLERRHLTLGDEPVHLDHLLARVIRSEAQRWPTHEFVVAPTGGNVVRGDETYIEQVLRNLASNAAKYSPSGSTVEVAVDDTAPDEVRVCVLDRGAGIAQAEVDDLFSLFYRSPTTAASAAGAGIGLFVSRRLVDEMGGRMWARPRPDGGSEFGFSLARYPTEDEDEDEDDEAAAGDASTAGADGRPPAATTAADGHAVRRSGRQ
jgi:two-component system sensor histidine kinase KdpD